MTKCHILLGASLVSLMAASAASAQTGNAPSDTAPAGQARPANASAESSSDDIIVTGFRASLQQSLEAKRLSDGVADVLSAEDIGKFPDKNVAEALQRVPGIVINREFGEGERVSLRGTAPNLTKTLVNGHGIATADWFILDQLSATRSFNYLTLPAEIVGQLDVYKSPQADVEEGGIGGTINVHTRHPLDLTPWAISASAQAVYSDRSGKWDPQASGLISWKNADETFGVLIGGVYQKREIRRDGVEVLGYQSVTTGGQTAQVPSLIGSALFQQERERYGGNVELQFRPSDSLEIVATGLYSRFNASNFNQNYLAWTANALGGGGTLTNATVQDGTVVKGTITSVPGGRAVVYDAIYRDAFAETWSGDLDLNWQVSDSGRLHVKGGYTRARGLTQSQPFYEGGAPGAFTFDITGRLPQVSFTGVDPTRPNDLIFDFASLHRVGNVDKEKYLYADFEQEVDWGPISALRIGGKVTDHDRVASFLATTYGSFFLPLSQSGCGGRACTSADFAGGSLPGDFLDNIALPGTLTNYFNVDTAKLISILNSQPAANRARVLNPPENYSINEKTYGGYVMARIGQKGDRFHGNFGVRVISTDQTSRGNQLGVPANTPGAVDNPFGTYLPIVVKKSYTDFLPSVNLAFDVTPTVVVRFAAGRTIARPDYTDIVPRVSLNPGSLTGDGGDPSVKPYRANGADLSVEWYPDRDTIVAAALYYKDIQSYIVNRTVQETFPVQTSTPNLSRCTLVDAGQQLYNCLFDINRRSNGAGGTNKGFELQVSRPIWGGFGAVVNYTYSDAKSNNGDPIPGNSKHALNVTGYYEDSHLSARVSYNYRSKFFINIDRASPLNQAATDSLDASLSYKITDNIALTADAVNLTNTKIHQYAGTETRFRALYDNGRIFYAGVRVRY
ncbi:MAG TPA: TonB-dependent receptor [Sphingomonas sp.]|nr:TonB-dependent receptor [Sphingomonas sp.]